MTIQRRTIIYDGPGGPFEGVFAWDDAQAGARPGVLVIPSHCDEAAERYVAREPKQSEGQLSKPFMTE